ncbi:polysaccharide deacetylase family protein [Paracrocinitomix mangrovi]|uniref:polysaccharide deacetylase family protein n=1 Tax=Paracrocinitomix mangrovi TaxID=2862509 RepID=UPI001C8D2F99|nr:polysaccharide deacetylase family protein [Paracrocinitomix mangrovi]UKN00473.1 polysaccharide deacetylase family protein [Paracrocinitomix mangrovi]
MQFRAYKIPKWPRRLFKGAIFDFASDAKTIYLTFDDGPHPETTPLLLDVLDQFNIKATFFCLGENVKDYPQLFQRILDKGHAIGNHAMNHIKGTMTNTNDYIKDVETATELINSKLFRPPYGKIKPSQFKALKQKGYRIIFWSIMAYDFDQNLSTDTFISKMQKLAYPGAIYVFHDNQKSIETIQNELPKVIEALIDDGYEFKKIEPELFS